MQLVEGVNVDFVKKTIDAGEVRLAEIMQSNKFDGQMACWYHQNCFFSQFHVLSIENFVGIDNLRWEDREKISERIGKKKTSPSKLPEGNLKKRKVKEKKKKKL